MTDIGQVGEPQREDDVTFWSRQLSEHALFFSLGIEDAGLRRTAASLHSAFESVRPRQSNLTMVLQLAAELRSYKTELLSQLNAGRWLGWIYPTFVDHTRRELDLFVANATGVKTSDAQQTCNEWLRFMAEHAAFAAHLMDPIEGMQIRDAIAFVGQFQRLRQACAAGVTPQLLQLTSAAGAALDKFVVGKVAKAKSIIHPVLAVHVVREGQRFLYTVRQLGLGGRH